MRRKRVIMASVLVGLVGWLVPADGASAPTVLIEHAYVGYTTDGVNYFLNYDLRVRNPTEQTLYNVTLTTGPLHNDIEEEVTVPVGDLEAKEIAAATVTMSTKRFPSEQQLQELPISWEVESADAAGQLTRSVAAGCPMLQGGLP